MCSRRLAISVLKGATIRSKLVIVILSVCTCALTLTGVVLLFYVRGAVRDSILREIEADARMAASHCNVALAFYNKPDVQRTLEALKAKPFVLLGCVYDRQDEAFASYVRPGFSGKVPVVARYRGDPALQGNLLTVVKDIELDGEALGTVLIQADLEPLRAASRKATVWVVLVAGTALALAVALALVLQRVISGPILALARVAREVSTRGDYSQRAAQVSDDEIGFLAKMLNQMLEQIQQRDGDLMVANKKLIEEVEERRIAEQHLEAVNQELKDFAYVVSHDLKAPLRGIQTLIDWICQDHRAQLGEEGQDKLKLLEDRAHRMHSLIEGVLQYSRAGRITEEKTVVDLARLVPSVIDLLNPPEHIEIRIEDRLPQVEFDETRASQVFQNLLSNAVKFMDKPKGMIRILCTEREGFWRFAIEDNGPGIEERHFERIFKLFQTLNAKDTYESTGVGLAVVKKIVEMYGGKIGVESRVGKGSTFWFTIPNRCHSGNQTPAEADPVQGVSA